jgi:hypothetical protein
MKNSIMTGVDCPQVTSQKSHPDPSNYISSVGINKFESDNNSLEMINMTPSITSSTKTLYGI